jgi:hypothetical protein
MATKHIDGLPRATEMQRQRWSFANAALRIQRHQMACFFFVATLVISGCGQKSDLRGVRGKVTIDAQPIESGTIEFTPIDGTKGGLAGSNITNGMYEVAQLHGVRSGGTYRVMIVAMKKTGRKVEGLSDRGGKLLDEYANYVPAAYSSETKLKVRITDDWVNHIDFPLKVDGSWPVDDDWQAHGEAH